MALDENVDVVSSDEESVEENGEMDVVDDSSDEGSETEPADDQTLSRVYLPNHDADQNQELEHEESAYICYHTIRTGSPCLSFDIVQDGLGDMRADQYPLTMTLVGGTQMVPLLNNSLLVMRLSNMHCNKKEDDEDKDGEDSDSEDDDEDEKKPVLECANISHEGCVNRVKVCVLGEDPYAASWSELGKVHIWNLSRPVTAVNNPNELATYMQARENVRPTFTFAGHQREGYAVEWSPLVPGVLATGDCKSNIHLWKPLEGGSWHVDQRHFAGHTDSVEDLQWSPNEMNVLASCSVDKSIRIWDIRVAPNKACMLTRADAHDSDVNVISWNGSEPFILSGGDDGKLRVWDLRKFPDCDPICTFKYHTAPITSVEWHPTDHSAFAASSADNVLSQWDLAVERDGEEEEEEEVRALPAQLLFLHQGQKDIKELHWHKQMPGVILSTAQSGINIFRTISV